MPIDFKALNAARKFAKQTLPNATPIQQELFAMESVGGEAGEAGEAVEAGEASEAPQSAPAPRAATRPAPAPRAASRKGGPAPAVQTGPPKNTTGLSTAMAGAGFETYTPQAMTRIMAINSGQEKNGKTEWAFSAPAPLAVISFDPGTLRIVNKHAQQGRRIIPCWMRVDRKDLMSDHQKNWDTVQRAVDAVLSDTSIRSLVIDTGTEMWDLLRLKMFGKLEQVMPHKYVEANAEMRRFIKGIYDSRLDLITVFPHKVKKEYKSDKKGDKDIWTGGYEFAGWNDFPFHADLIIRNFRDDTAEDGEPFKVLIKDCGPEAALNNMTFSGPEAKLPALASIMYPEIDPKAWEDS